MKQIFVSLVPEAIKLELCKAQGSSTKEEEMAHVIVDNWIVIPVCTLIAFAIAVRIGSSRAYIVAAAIMVIPSFIAWACTSFDIGSLLNLGVVVSGAALIGFFHPELIESFRGWLRQPRIAGFLVQASAVIAVLVLVPQIALAQLLFAWVLYQVLKATLFPKKSHEQH